MGTPELIHAVLTSPESVVWEGEALSVSSTNTDGPFDLFPDHARFMTLLEGVELEVRLPEGTSEVFSIEKAVLFFQDAQAKIYLHTHIDAKRP